MRLATIGLTLSALLFSSCATIAHGRYQQIPVASDPAGADIYADCGRGPRRIGETPKIVKLARKADRCMITLRKNGYEDETTIFTRSMSGWVWGNLLLSDGAIVGAIIDLYDGAFYNRAPNSVDLRLRRAADSGSAAK